MKKIVTLLLMLFTSVSIIIAQPGTVCNAGFDYSFLAANTIKFTPAVIGDSNNTMHSWSFGDGASSSIATPTHTYNTNGVFYAKHIIKRVNPNGVLECRDTVIKQILIQQACNLNAFFSFSNATSNPSTYNFTNLTSNLLSTDLVKWTFGDGTSSLDVNAAHTYLQPGTYTVCLSVKRNNSAGTSPCVSEICKTIVIQAPCNFQISFSSFKDTINLKKIIFTNHTNLSNTNATAKWIFGDGSTSTSWNAVHEYAQPGKYRVCLIIQTGPNCIKDKCDTIVIETPSADCKDLSKFTFEKLNNDNQKFKFKPNYVAADVQYTWTFGDGTGSHDANATHRYYKPGVYTACLTAWRNTTCASTTCKEIKVLPQINCDSVRFNYSYKRDSIITNKFFFYATASLPILDQTWAITKISPTAGTPKILHQNNPVYIFGDTGTYKVCVKAIILGGCVKEECKIIKIEKITNSTCELQVYPNPAINVINVKVNLTAPVVIKAYLYNSLNVLIKNKTIEGTNGNNVVTFNTSDLVAGIYSIKLVYGNKICYARFMKL